MRTEVQADGIPASWALEPLGGVVNSVRESAKIAADRAYELWSVPSFADGLPERVVGREIGSGKLLVRSQDVLISKINPRINRVWIVSEPPEGFIQVASTEWIVARIDAAAGLLPRFLQWYATSPAFRHMIEDGVQGVTGSHTRAKTPQVLKLPVPIPPLPEQQRIVEILEEQLSRLDAALVSVRVVREKAAQFRRSLLHAAFTGALTGRATEPGHAPKGWVLERLDSVASVQLGRSRSPKNHSGPNMRPYLRAANVTWRGLDLADVSEMNFSDKEMETYRLEPGDILVNEASGSASEVGKAAVFRGEISDCGFQNHLIRVRTNHLDNAYLHHFLMHNALSGAYVAESQGVGINHLGKGKLSAWPTPVPPLPEQQRIVEILKEQLSRLDASLAVADAVEKRSAALRRSLLHAAFTGRLTEQWREHAHV
jgi:hypothetical protein